MPKEKLELCPKPGHTGYVDHCPQCANSPLNMMRALGVIGNGPHGPTKPPEELTRNVLGLTCKYLLYERSEETVISRAFLELAMERHNRYHRDVVKGMHKGVAFETCSNDVCIDARDIIKHTRSKEIFVSPIAYELMQGFNFNFMPMPNQLRVWLSKVEDSLPATDEQKRKASNIVLTD